MCRHMYMVSIIATMCRYLIYAKVNMLIKFKHKTFNYHMINMDDLQGQGEKKMWEFIS